MKLSKTYQLIILNKKPLSLLEYYDLIPSYNLYLITNIPRLNKIDKFKLKNLNKLNKPYYVKKTKQKLIFFFLTMLCKGRSKLLKRFLSSYLNYFDQLSLISTSSLIYLTDKSIINYSKFLGIDIHNLQTYYKEKLDEIKYGGLYNINPLLEKSIKQLYLGVAFDYITNVVKSKRKIKTTILKPKYIFGDKKKKHALKHLTNQILKSNKQKNLKSLLGSNFDINIKEELNLKVRLNWSITQLFFNLNKSIFYKRKWSIFTKFYSAKAPMYF